MTTLRPPEQLGDSSRVRLAATQAPYTAVPPAHLSGALAAVTWWSWRRGLPAVIAVAQWPRGNARDAA